MKLFTSLHLLPITALASLLMLGSCTNRRTDITTIASSSGLTYQGQTTDSVKGSAFCTRATRFSTPATGIKACGRARDGLKTHSAAG